MANYLKLVLALVDFFRITCNSLFSQTLFQLQYIYKGIINDIAESFIKVYTTFEAKDTVYKNAAENS